MSVITQLITGFLGAPAEQIAEYFKEKQKLKMGYKLAEIRAKTAAMVAREKRAIQADTDDHEWEMLQIRNSGWKDEFVLLVVSIPMVLSFIPGMDVYVLHGFIVLEKTPLWYQILLTSIFFAVYGIRYYHRNKLRQRTKVNEQRDFEADAE